MSALSRPACPPSTAAAIPYAGIAAVSPPPSRFSAEAKAAWDTAPEALRAEVSRMEKEFAAGFAKYKTAAERDASLAEFHGMASRSGKNLRDVVANYAAMENQLRADPIKGLEIICQNVGLSLREVAAWCDPEPRAGQGRAGRSGFDA
jgi:hypothetical protein